MTPESRSPSSFSPKLAASLVGGLAVLVGGMVLTGWALDIAALKSVLPGWVAMKPNTALSFILAGMALLFSRPPSAFRLKASAFGSHLSRLCALLAGLIGVLSLAEYIFGWNPGFDQWLFPEPAGAVGTSNPGRMAPDAALCFMLFAAGWEFARRPRQTTWTLTASMLFGSAITAAALIEILSYFTPTLRAYGWGGLTMMALPTAVVFAALGAALIGFAVRGKTAAADSPAQPSAESRSGGGLQLLLIFALLATGSVAAGIFYLQRYERQFRSDVEHRLSAIADLKVSELTLWRKERLGDGSILFQNSSISALVRRFLEKPEDADAQRQLQLWIEKVQVHYGHDRVCLLDAQGITRLSSPAELTPASSDIVRSASEVLRSGQMMFQDFYRNEQDQRIYLAILVPIFDDTDASRPLGTLVLRIDPTSYLYPFIQRWPVPTQTAETLLFRQDGNDVQYLNDLRFRPGAALTLRLPISRTDLPAARAVLGQTGIVQGTDYRGAEVLANLRRIPDSPWFIVAKVDLAEIYEPTRGHLWQVVAMIGILLFGAGAGVGLVWWRQRARFDRANYESMRSRMQLAAIVETSDDAIIGKDLNGIITSWNAGAENLFGYPTGEMVGTSIMRLIPADRQAEERQILGQIKRGESLAHFETQRQTKDGRLIDVSIAASPIKDASGRIIGVSKVARDITERKRAADEIRQLNAELEQRVRDRTAELEAANKELEAFSYSVSHDLRAPLRAMDGFSMALLEEHAGRLDESGRHYLRRIRAGSQQMADLIDDLLGLARLTRDTLHRERVDLTAMAGRIGAELQQMNPARTVELMIAPTLTTNADPAMARVVMNNLLGNAWKFTAGRAAARVEVGAAKQDGERVFFVRDNGAGFDMAFAGKLFGAFQRLHSAAEFEGNGIGLALVQRIARRHGGRVWAEGAVGQGATFHFTLEKKGTES